MKTRIFSILLALVLAGSLLVMALPTATPVEASPGTHYYVDDATGDDGNDGSSWAKAWKTITHAVANVPAGAGPADPNVIHVADGAYASGPETFPITFADQNVTLLADYTTTPPTIDGEGTETILEIEATGITIDGFTIENADEEGIRADVSGFRILDNTFSDVDHGVYLEIDEDDLTTDYTVDEILIRGNEFNISEDGVYIEILLDYDYTASNVIIGDIDIRGNTFNMGTTRGIRIDTIAVLKLNGGRISMGDVNISGNQFYDGDVGIDFHGRFGFLETDTTVTVGDVIINDNYFKNQTSVAMAIDYYAAENWYGTTTGTFGDLVINGNDITSTEWWYDAINIADFGCFVYFHDDASLTVGDIYIEGNDIDVDDWGIYIDYYEVGYEMYGNSAITVGDVHIENNEIDAGSEAIYFDYEEEVAYEMNDGDTMPDGATLLMGDIYIQDNQISGDDYGIYLYYKDEEVGQDMYCNAYAELPDYVITGNTFNVTGDGIYLYTYENPYGIYDNATIDFGGFVITGNTFNDEDAGMEYGIYFDSYHFCYGNYDNSTTIIGDVIITDNQLYNLSEDAVYIDYEDIGEYLHDYSILEVGDLVIADNVIDGAYDGIDVDYYGVYSKEYSTVTMGNLDITGNDISNVDEESGIYFYYGPDAYNNSTINIGRGLIQGNTIDTIDDDGIDFSYWSEAHDNSTINMGQRLIQGNTLDTCGSDGIYASLSPDAYDNSTINIDQELIQGNTIDTCDSDGIYMSMSIHIDPGATVNLGNPVIGGNTVENCGDDGIYLWQVENATVSDNTVQNCEGDGICLRRSSNNNQILRNDILNNQELHSGIDLDSDCENNVIHCNNIVGNSTYGVCNDNAAEVVDAENNWWGDASGPSGFGPGTGDAVSDNVDYSPWLTFPFVAVEADFSANPTSGLAPLTVQFRDKSTDYIEAWQWNFGDGATSNKQNPTHEYTKPGEYTVTLEVITTCDTDTAVKQQYISVSEKPPAKPPARPARPARFLTSYPGVVPAKVQPNKPVSVLVDVKNIGSSSGRYDAVLYINDEVEDTQTAYISPGQTQRLIFTVYRATPGKYWASVGGYGAWFTVAEAAEVAEYEVVTSPPPPSGGLGTPALLAIILGSIGVGVAIFFATRPQAT